MGFAVREEEMTRLLTAREVAECLSLSPETVLSWARSGDLPSFKLPSGQIRFSEEALDAWLLARSSVGGSRLHVIEGGSEG